MSNPVIGMENVTEAIDNQEDVDVVYLDFAKLSIRDPTRNF